MSIYAGPFLEIQFNIHSLGDRYVGVFFMSVPGHIGCASEGYEDGDPYASFLPTPLTTEEYETDEHQRAVVIVADDFDEKEGQQYVNAIATLSYTEWESISFPELAGKIFARLRDLYGLRKPEDAE